MGGEEEEEGRLKGERTDGATLRSGVLRKHVKIWIALFVTSFLALAISLRLMIYYDIGTIPDVYGPEQNLGKQKFKHYVKRPLPKGKCLVTQIGTDGFGHQMSAKLSYAAFTEWASDFVYVENGISYLDHVDNVKNPVSFYEELVPLGAIYHRTSEIRAKNGSIPQFVRMNVNILVDLKKSGKLNCDDTDVIYWDDNAWWFEAEYKEITAKSAIFNAIRAGFYESHARLPTGFPPGRRNIAMHVRRGDAASRASDIAYFRKGIDFYIEYFRTLGDVEKPFFTVDTDQEDWEGLEIIKQYVGAENFELGKKFGDPTRAAFTRMVLADGLIGADSSFSGAAARLRDPRIPVVAPCQDGAYKAIFGTVKICT